MPLTPLHLAILIHSLFNGTMETFQDWSPSHDACVADLREAGLIFGRNDVNLMPTVDGQLHIQKLLAIIPLSHRDGDEQMLAWFRPSRESMKESKPQGELKAA